MLVGSEAQGEAAITSEEPMWNEPRYIQNAAQQAVPKEMGELKASSAIEQTITAGESHSYRITLKAEEYVNLVVEQAGINIAVELADPKKQAVADSDWWWREGTESIWGLAESSGDYMLKISASRYPVETGKYRIKFVKQGAWQGAPPTDLNYVTAYKKYGEGERLLAQGTAESQRQAIEKHQEALALWINLKDGNAEGQARNEIGAIKYRLGSLKEAAEYLDQAILLFRAAGNRFGEVNSLNILCVVYVFSGEPQKAFDHYSRALTMARAIKDPITEGRVLSGLGVVLPRLGQTEKALATLSELITLSRATGNLSGESQAHNNIGAIYVTQGRLREAIEQYNQTLLLLQQTGDRFNQATILNNIGNAYARMGEFQQALEYLLRGVKLAQTTGDRRGEALNLGGIGHLYMRLRDYPKAREYYEQSLALSRSTNIRAPESGALNNLGVIYGGMGDLPRALDYSNQALLLFAQLGDRSGEAAALTNLGSVYKILGETQKALDYYEKALVARRAAEDQYGEAYTLSARGAVYEQMGNESKALDHLTRALALTRKVGDRLGEADTLYQLARLERRGGNFGQARHRLEEALKIVESTRAKVSLADTRAVYFASRQEMYDFYIDLLMQPDKSGGEGDVTGAWLANERRSARNLAERLAEVSADLHAGVAPELLQREARLQQDLSAKADQQVRLLSRKHTADQAAALAKEIEALTIEYEQALAQIRQASPRYAALTQPEPTSLKHLQAEVLDSGTLLLEYSLGEERSYLWAITQTSIKGYELPKRSTLESTARRFYDLLIAKADTLYPEVLNALSEMLLKPVADQLGGKRLLIVSDGALHYVPFGALPLPSASASKSGNRRVGRNWGESPQPVIEHHEIVSLPSASVLAILRREMTGRRPAPNLVAVLADPVFDKEDQRVKAKLGNPPAEGQASQAKVSEPASTLTDTFRSMQESGLTTFERLLLSRREAEAIHALVPGNQSLQALDFTASRATAISPELGRYRIVHFATHSLLNNQHPGLSGIVLSLVDQQGKPQDGFLRLYEIYNLRLNADLVVLSSCQTALGKEFRGEGLVGLTRGFMYAGAPRVVASLWKVSDKATAELMKRFYQKMLKDGLRPAAALRAAQVSMLREKQWQAAYYWAGFLLQGEWK